MNAYYNENNREAAIWLRELIRAGHIAPGEVDERSIVDVQPDDLRGFGQCHFFAGIGGWPDDQPVWTGSCPCQPYSVGSVAHGGAKGQCDSRDLWPQFFGLIGNRRPPVVFGKQVASAVPWGWWDRAASDLERHGYATGAAVLRADSFGAEHQRKRLYWVADSGGKRREGHQQKQCVSLSETKTFAIDGDPLARARRALDGDLDGLLHCDGLSVVMERSALGCYGNAIVPQVAAHFIQAFCDAVKGSLP